MPAGIEVVDLDNLCRGDAWRPGEQGGLVAGVCADGRCAWRPIVAVIFCAERYVGPAIIASFCNDVELISAAWTMLR